MPLQAPRDSPHATAAPLAASPVAALPPSSFTLRPEEEQGLSPYSGPQGKEEKEEEAGPHGPAAYPPHHAPQEEEGGELACAPAVDLGKSHTARDCGAGGA